MRFSKGGVLTFLAVTTATPLDLSAHPGHEPAAAGALAAKFHALFGVSPGVALAAIGVLLVVTHLLRRPRTQPD